MFIFAAQPRLCFGVNYTVSLYLKMKFSRFLVAAAAPIVSVRAAYSWSNVKIGGGGGFVPGIVFHPNASGVAYARTDIGGLYKLNSDDSWTALSDNFTTDAAW